MHDACMPVYHAGFRRYTIGWFICSASPPLCTFSPSPLRFSRLRSIPDSIPTGIHLRKRIYPGLPSPRFRRSSKQVIPSIPSETGTRRVLRHPCLPRRSDRFSGLLHTAANIFGSLPFFLPLLVGLCKCLVSFVLLFSPCGLAFDLCHPLKVSRCNRPAHRIFCPAANISRSRCYTVFNSHLNQSFFFEILFQLLGR